MFRRAPQPIGLTLKVGHMACIQSFLKWMLFNFLSQRHKGKTTASSIVYSPMDDVTVCKFEFERNIVSQLPTARPLAQFSCSPGHRILNPRNVS
uniref:Secreted protein n=1 Tax=Globodera pallida TaxID=36090 RepID=A0A183CTB8_GLOPA